MTEVVDSKKTPWWEMSRGGILAALSVACLVGAIISMVWVNQTYASRDSALMKTLAATQEKVVELTAKIVGNTDRDREDLEKLREITSELEELRTTVNDVKAELHQQAGFFKGDLRFLAQPEALALKVLAATDEELVGQPSWRLFGGIVAGVCSRVTFEFCEHASTFVFSLPAELVRGFAIMAKPQVKHFVTRHSNRVDELQRLFLPFDITQMAKAVEEREQMDRSSVRPTTEQLAASSKKVAQVFGLEEISSNQYWLACFYYRRHLEGGERAVELWRGILADLFTATISTSGT